MSTDAQPPPTVDPDDASVPERQAGGTVQRLQRHRETDLPGVLLTSSGFLGTLAAVRCFGQARVASVVADAAHFGPASWSRFVSSRLKCPPDSQPERLLQWLLAFGQAHPGHVLCATSDESAWLYSKCRAELGRYFHMYQPSVEAVYSLLNKRRLYEIAAEENVDFPRTWFPQSEADLQSVLAQAQFPVLTKPVTQILHKTHAKGAVIDDPSDVARFFRFMSRDTYQPELLAYDPSVACPIFQEFHPTSAAGIYSISGFIDESGMLLGVRGAMKILQRPRQLGVGLCFERADVKPALVDAIARICRRVGYYGVFEVEFVHRDGKDLLIDFNPRFYGQMAFDIARGLPVPLMVYYAALGEWRTLKELAEAAQRQTNDETAAVHCNLLEFEIMLRAQRLSGGFSAEQVKFWRDWYKGHRGRIVHPIFDRDDWKPFASEITRQFLEYVRHPRASIKSTIMKALMLGLPLQQNYV
jgi:predicted ATP-grasp superfamily ATP-dependent carboligase